MSKEIKRIFTDFHHASLLNSFVYLFEDRLGYEVYRPIGIEWAQSGYWKVYDHPETQAQFLGIGSATPDGTPPLNEVEVYNGGIYYCQDIDSGYYNKAITLSTFLELHFDIVIASLPQHIEPFTRLCEQHPDHPKLIFQIGNSWTTDAGLAKNIMASAIINSVPADINFVSYHQEFNVDLFHETHPHINNSIYSFINCFDSQPHFVNDWDLFTKCERIMNDWDFKSYGGQCRDGAAHGSAQVSDYMREAMFVWHTKNGGDGYGHVIHNAACMGKPMIVNASYYAGKMAEALIKDGETCIVIDGLNPQEVVNKILHYSDIERYTQLCRNAAANFKNTVNFDKEAENIKEFINRLK